MEIKGKLQIILPVAEGTSKNGPWKKQEFVIESNEGKFPKQIFLNVWGADKVDEFKRYKIGDILVCSLDISSREYNGRWYTDLRAWKITTGEMGSSSGSNNHDYNAPFSNNEQPGVVTDNGINSNNNNWEGDLPF
jgi:hypothetical protein